MPGCAADKAGVLASKSSSVGLGLDGFVRQVLLCPGLAKVVCSSGLEDESRLVVRVALVGNPESVRVWLAPLLGRFAIFTGRLSPSCGPPTLAAGVSSLSSASKKPAASALLLTESAGLRMNRRYSKAYRRVNEPGLSPVRTYAGNTLFGLV